MSQFAPSALRIPPGFEHLLEDLAKEILRDQPPDIISFSAKYFRRRLRERDGKVFYDPHAELKIIFLESWPHGQPLLNLVDHLT